MFHVSVPAAQRMSDLLAPLAQAAALRIVRRGGRYRLRLSRARPGDQTFAHAGRVVLALDRVTCDSLAGRTLGVRSTPTGPRLRLGSR